MNTTMSSLMPKIPFHERHQVITLLADMIEEVQNGMYNAELTHKQLSELRLIAIDAEQPLAAKAIRLVMEALDTTGNITVECFDEEDLAGISAFEYFLQLLQDPTNRYNREDLRALRDELNVVD